MALDTTGLTTQTYEEILDNIIDIQRTLISSKINADDDTSLGQLNKIMSAQLALVNQGLQDIYDARNIWTAEGKALDDIVSWRGITRQAASATYGSIALTGDVGTNVPAGTVFKSETNSKVYTLDANKTLTITACSFVSIRNIAAIASGTDYSVSVDGTTYTSGTGHTTAAAMFDAIKTAINLAAAGYTADVNGSDQLTITSDTNDEMLITHDVNLASVKATCFGTITCTETGSTVQPANTVQTIVTSLAGLNSVNNTSNLITGREVETDNELRARTIAAASASGRATVDSIITAILQLDGVSSCSVNEQFVSDGTAVSGQPAGSILVVVTGGTDNDIWQTIWDYKPAGVETWDAGVPANTNPAGVVVDTNGENQFVSFSRPTTIPIYVVVEFEVFDTDVYPDTNDEAYDAITAAIIEFGNSLGTGEDVDPAEFIGVVYSAVGGIKAVTVEMSDIDFPSVGTAVISIGATEKALFADATTQVTNVT